MASIFGDIADPLLINAKATNNFENPEFACLELATNDMLHSYFGADNVSETLGPQPAKSNESPSSAHDLCQVRVAVLIRVQVNEQSICGRSVLLYLNKLVIRC